MPKHAANETYERRATSTKMGKHDVDRKRPATTRFKDPIPSTASKVTTGPETGIAVKAAEKAGQHRAPKSSYTREELAAGRASTTTGGSSSSSSSFSTRGSRTRYIRYVGNDEAGNVGKLVGEWLVGVLLISITVPLQSGANGYQKVMTSVMYRLTAITAVFFVLAIVASGRGGKAAVYFGLVVDLAILFNAIRNGTIGNVGKVFSGVALTGESGSAKPAADITDGSSGVPITVWGTAGSAQSSSGSSSGTGGFF